MQRFGILGSRSAFVVLEEDVLQVFPTKDVELVFALPLYVDEDTESPGSLDGFPPTDKLNALCNLDSEKLPCIQLPRRTANGLDLDLNRATVRVHGENVKAGEAAGKGRRNPASSTQLGGGKVLAYLTR